MEESTPRIRSMLRQADKIAEAGKRAAATNLYRQIIDEAPDTAAAWIGLAGVISDENEKEQAYRQALIIEPENESAQRGLNILLGIEIPVEIGSSEADDAGKNGATDEKEVELSQTINYDSPEDAEKLPTNRPTSGLTTEILGSDGHEHADGDDPHFGHDHSGEITVGKEVLYCANHPSRKTHLRCNRCGKPICSSCAQPTPVGYRCPECIREHEDIFYTATVLDYVIAALVAVPLSLLAGWLATFLGFFTIFLGAFAGSLIGRVVFRVAGRRRGRWMPQMVGAIVVIGGILPAIPFLLAIFFGGFSLQLIWSGIYIVSAAGAAYYQMR
jgi:hypothetical protein